MLIANRYTVYPKKYAHGFVVLCFVVVMQSFIMNSYEVFIHIHQGCFAGTGAIVRLPQCQWSKPDGYEKISQCITTTKHSKAKTVCIFLGIYCTHVWELFIFGHTRHLLHGCVSECSASRNQRIEIRPDIHKSLLCPICRTCVEIIGKRWKTICTPHLCTKWQWTVHTSTLYNILWIRKSRHYGYLCDQRQCIYLTKAL